LVATTVNPSLKALVTLAEFQQYLNQTDSALGDDRNDWLLTAINVASMYLETECRVPLIKASVTEYYDGSDEKPQSAIILRGAPVDTTATFTVIEDGITLTACADGSSYTSAGASPDFYLDPDTGIIYRSGTWASGRRIVKVTYTAGRGWQYKSGTTKRTLTSEALSSTDIPDDLRQAALMTAKAFTDMGPTNWGTQVLPDGQVLRPVVIPLAGRLILDQYRMPRGV
jgi:hypothetical protein